MKGMKKKILLFSVVLFCTILCASFGVYKKDSIDSSQPSLKDHFSQKTNKNIQSEISNVFFIDDLSDVNDVEKVKFDYSILGQQWLDYFFENFSFNTPIFTLSSHVHLLAPRYILYHSFKIADC
ncbi:hypothetical protein D1631_08305 [Chryseobacterium nematophagum]|uniref:Uncharacterized protein n=2 Tax=Chryseobacterium nematophagum TaxID=2305228 RepID=A0A3M7TEI7_9FLAO|nr:hypothetical protein D1631_08305 [Chryseobacterium nematophagum]